MHTILRKSVKQIYSVVKYVTAVGTREICRFRASTLTLLHSRPFDCPRSIAAAVMVAVAVAVAGGGRGGGGESREIARLNNRVRG